MFQRFVPDQARVYPRYVRAQDQRVVAGVAAGLSAHVGVEVAYVRAVLTGLSFFGGFGLVLYALVWMFTPVGAPERPVVDGKQVGGFVNVALVILAFVLWSLSTNAVGEPRDVAFFAVVLVVAVGAVLAWRAYDRDVATAGSVLSLVVGGTLVMGGVVVVALLGESSNETGVLSVSSVTGVIVAVLASVVGVGVLVVPLVAKLLRSLVRAREGKAAADQRADIAAHLHDSVLQTLTLIQKHAGDSAQVARLARGQERELRAWLYDAPAAPTTFFTAVNQAAGEVEDLYGARIQPVTAGEDIPCSGDVEAIILAAREAMINAAKHSTVEAIDVFAEHASRDAGSNSHVGAIDAGEKLSVYVRDRGIGFDLTAVPADRHGVRDSITARMERAGGTATITTAPGAGTEVVVTLPVPATE